MIPVHGNAEFHNIHKETRDAVARLDDANSGTRLSPKDAKAKRNIQFFRPIGQS